MQNAPDPSIQHSETIKMIEMLKEISIISEKIDKVLTCNAAIWYSHIVGNSRMSVAQTHCSCERFDRGYADRFVNSLKFATTTLTILFFFF